ncbi:MAG: patatin-like phospholipase family protein [Ignavibacteria bacterium]|nr:patatin-like phospholipase family protein [Ignavibacteria bacterium]
MKNRLFEKILISLLLIFFCNIFNVAYSQINPDSNKTVLTLPLRPKENFDTNRFNIFSKKYNLKKVALVLSGGGARGFAQIGVLKALERSGIQIDMIVGTSIGAIIGGLYSSGYTANELDSLARNINWTENLKLTNKYNRQQLFPIQKSIQDKSILTVSLEGLKPVIPTSLSSGQQITEILNTLFLNSRYRPNYDFSNIKYRFFSVATDLNKGTREVLSNGNITECVKASFTFPLLYTPMQIKGRLLIDGGLTANIPVDVAFENGADYVITVNSTSPLKTEEELKENPINTADQIVSITMARLNEQQLKKSNFTITPEIGRHNAEDFSNINFLISKGEESTYLRIEELKKSLDSLEAAASPQFNYFIINPKVIIDSPLIPDSIKTGIIAYQENNFVKYITIEKTMRNLYDLGYFRDVKAEIFRKDGELILKYAFEENPILKSIKTNSKYGFLDSTINEFSKANLNKILNYKKLETLYETLLGQLKSHGYSSIDITKFYFNWSESILEIEFDNGLINNIIVTGNITTKKEMILSELTINNQRPITENQILNDLRNLYSLNLFTQLTFNILNTGNSKDLTINLVEKSSKTLSLALRADNERNLQAFVDIRDQNVFGTGTEIGLSLIGGLRNFDLKFDINRNKIFKTDFTFNLSGYYTFVNHYLYREDISNNSFSITQLGEYRNIKFGASLLVGTQLEKIGTVYSQISIENFKTKNISNTNFDFETRVFKLKFGGKIDTQDEYPFPNQGTIIEYYYETAQNQLRGSEAYSKLYLDFEHYFAIDKSLSLKPKFLFAFADNATPLNDWFFMGGENNFMGMVEDEISGRQLFISSLEFRYKLPFKIFFDTYLSYRYDLGRIWNNTSDIKLIDLRHGMGLSAIFSTPLGKASFSFGKCFYINEGIENNLVWGPNTFYFTIGYDL